MRHVRVHQLSISQYNILMMITRNTPCNRFHSIAGDQEVVFFYYNNEMFVPILYLSAGTTKRIISLFQQEAQGPNR